MGLGIAGLSTGGVVASIVIAVAIVVTTAFAIVAFVGRELLRSFAIGFLVPVVIYSATLFWIGNSELNPYEGKLPTTKIIRPVFELIVKREYVDVTTGKLVPDYDPTANVGIGVGGFGGSPVGVRETPDRTTFMSLAHVLLGMIFGYVGAKFAVWIERKQSNGTQRGE